MKIKVHISGHSDQMSKISGQLLISGQFQDICHISGISGQLGALKQGEREREIQTYSDVINKPQSAQEKTQQKSLNPVPGI